MEDSTLVNASASGQEDIQMAWSNPRLALAAVGLLFITITLYVMNDHPEWKSAKAIKARLHGMFRSRPGRLPLSEFCEEEKNVLKGSPPAADYKDVLPPSTRDTLALVAQSLPEVQKSRLSGRESNQAEIKNNLMSFTADYKECGPSTYTPMGIALEEVEALGDFPDYASLSGVPLPEAYKDFDITKAIARPYRPFRWAYHQTMSLSRLETNWWLELESTYKERIAERKTLFATHGKLVLNYLPGSELACKEIMEHVLQFLCARYPQHFALFYSSTKGSHIFRNKLLDTTTETKTMHPLHILLNNIPEDFAIMVRNPTDGHYYFRAGLLCSSLGWNVDTKLGMKLSEIHQPIPDYKTKMSGSMDRYFAKLPTSKPIQRGSWGLEVDQPLFMPPRDPHERYRLKQDPDLELSRLHLRVDWQTLRRLPLSGAIVFNFKALFTPVEEFRTEPYIPALISTVLKQGNPAIMTYKSTWHVEHKVIPALDSWAHEQEKNGTVEKGWEVRTLDESPWFPGWEEKWRGQQGF